MKVNNAILVTRNKLDYCQGISEKSGRPYEFIGTQVAVGDRVHDVTFDIETWNAIAQSASALSKVVLEGDLVIPDDGYVVHADDDARRYVRGKLTSPELVDIVDNPGAKIAFKRGARLPSAAQLKARAEAEAENDVEAGDDAEDIGNA